MPFNLSDWTFHGRLIRNGFSLRKTLPRSTDNNNYVGVNTLIKIGKVLRQGFRKYAEKVSLVPFMTQNDFIQSSNLNYISHIAVVVVYIVAIINYASLLSKDMPFMAESGTIAVSRLLYSWHLWVCQIN